MFLKSSGPPQRTHLNDILPINYFVTNIRKGDQREFYDRGYSHGVRKYESDTKNAYSRFT